MTKNDRKYQKYRLTYPIVGNKTYESASFNKAIEKCYKEYKQIMDIREGMFIVTELDSKTEYQFIVSQ